VKGTLSVYDEITSIGPITFMPNGEVIANVVDAEFTVTGDDNTSDQLILTLRNTTATTNDTDEIKIRAMMDDDEGDEDGFGEISFTADDASSGSEDGSIVFTAITAGTSVTEWIMDGAALYPYIEGGGGIGKTGFGVGNVFVNGDITATSGTGHTFGSIDVASSATVKDVKVYDMLDLWAFNGMRIDASSVDISASYTIKGVYMTQLSLTGTSVSVTSLGGTWDATDLIVYSPSMVLSGSTVYQVVAKNELSVVDFYTSPSGSPGAAVSINVLLVDK
jgi:hypothetical protein